MSDRVNEFEYVILCCVAILQVAYYMFCVAIDVASRLCVLTKVKLWRLNYRTEDYQCVAFIIINWIKQPTKPDNENCNDNLKCGHLHGLDYFCYWLDTIFCRRQVSFCENMWVIRLLFILFNGKELKFSISSVIKPEKVVS